MKISNFNLELVDSSTLDLSMRIEGISNAAKLEATEEELKRVIANLSITSVIGAILAALKIWGILKKA